MFNRLRMRIALSLETHADGIYDSVEATRARLGGHVPELEIDQLVKAEENWARSLYGLADALWPGRAVGGQYLPADGVMRGVPLAGSEDGPECVHGNNPDQCGDCWPLDHERPAQR